jgi:hypothetical protein
MSEIDDVDDAECDSKTHSVGGEDSAGYDSHDQLGPE